jgi:hypothetical protein
MGNVADCCSRFKIALDTQTVGGNGNNAFHKEENEIAQNGTNSGAQIRILSQEESHRRYVRLIEDRRRNRILVDDSRSGLGIDDTDMMEGTLYLDETTVFQGPLTDDETGYPFQNALPVLTFYCKTYSSGSHPVAQHPHRPTRPLPTHTQKAQPSASHGCRDSTIVDG